MSWSTTPYRAFVAALKLLRGWPKSKSTAFETLNHTHWPVTVLGILSSSVGVILPIIVVRILTAPEVGEFKVFFLYLAVAPALSLSNGLMSGIAYWASSIDRRPAFTLTFVMTTAISLLSGVILLCFGTKVIPFFSEHPSAVAVFTLAMFGSLVGALYDEMAIASGQRWRGAIFGAVSEGVRIGGLLLALLITRSLNAVLITFAALSLVKATCGVFLAWRDGLLGSINSTSLAVSSLSRRVTKYALPVSIAGLCAIVVKYTDQLALSTILSKADFALYALGCLTLAPLFSVEQSVTRVLIPSISHHLANNALPKAIREYRDGISTLALLMIPITCGLVVFAEPIVTLLFTPHYIAAAPILRIFAFSYLLLSIPENAIARARGDSRWILNSFAWCAAWTLLASLSLAYLFAAPGALIGALSGGALLRVFALLDSARTLKISVWACLPLLRIASMAVVAIGGGIMAYLSRPMFDNPYLWLFCVGGLYGCVTGSIWWAAVRPASHKGTADPTLLLISQSLHTGGIERLIADIAEECITSGKYHPIVFAYDHNNNAPDQEVSKRLIASGATVILTKKPSRFSLAVVRQLYQVIRGRSVVVIHTHDLGGLIYASLANKLCGGNATLLHTQHSFIHLAKHWRYAWYEWIFTSIADGISAVSDEVQRRYQDVGISPSRVVVIPNGVRSYTAPLLQDSERTALRLQLLKTHLDTAKLPSNAINSGWILCLARVYPQKGQDHALTMWRALPEVTQQRSVLLFVGPLADAAFAKKLRNQSMSLPHSERIMWIGATGDPIAWMRAASVFLTLSEYEGYPLAPLEAIVNGAPTIASAIPGHEPFAPFADLVSLENPEAVAKLVDRILGEDQDDLRNIRESAWERCKELRATQSLHTMTANYLEWYLRHLPGVVDATAAARVDEGG